MKIYIADIFREKSGLAMSSRNERLSVLEKEKSKIIYEALKIGCFFTKNSLLEDMKNLDVVSVIDIIDVIKNKLYSEKLVQKIYYIEIRNIEDFTPAKNIEHNKKYVILISVQFAGIHLIDNILI